jgi:hypothetical protein
MRPVLALPRAINQAIAKYYAPGMRDEPAAAEEPASAKAAATKSGAKKDAKPEKATTKSPPRSKSAPLTAEQKGERVKIAAIISCWITMGIIWGAWLLGGGVVTIPVILLGAAAGAGIFAVLKFTWAA